MTKLLAKLRLDIIGLNIIPMDAMEVVDQDDVVEVSSDIAMEVPRLIDVEIRSQPMVEVSFGVGAAGATEARRKMMVEGEVSLIAVESLV